MKTSKSVSHADELELQVRNLKASLATAKTNRDEWKYLLSEGGAVQQQLELYEADARNQLEELIDAKGDDVKRLQADIRARRDLVNHLRDLATDKEVDAITRDLEHLTSENQLFLNGDDQ